ncbi:hypothetical protein [Aquimarina intermedia]|uniref:Uncharacterized protein n=1 Tax=Aquimarina intermedia TaxID=350814 RepID=A0A5S5BZY9_9FLAO|nr:hypothetical protein [Aquimarina intermedia]TYP72761.1 hypothetical protein BD809_1069 [Aquimarina intermedia]
MSKVKIKTLSSTSLFGKNSIAFWISLASYAILLTLLIGYCAGHLYYNLTH